jgi:uncharacterized protein (TIGR02284 family)
MDSKSVIKTLNDLIETCKDGEFGFRACAEHVKSSSLRETLGNRANDCRSAAAELQTIVSRLGGEPEDDGSVSGALERGWVSVRATLATRTDQAMLEECERGEDAALSRYRDALNGDDLPADIRPIVERQYEGVKRNHAQIRSLRDQARSNA